MQGSLIHIDEAAFNQMNTPLNLNLPVLLEGIPHPTMILDDSFRIIVMNRLMEAMTGYSTDRVAGIHGELVIRSNTGNSKGQLYGKVMQTGETVSVTGDIINSYRRKIAVQYTIAILDQTDGSRYGLLVMLEDLSARKDQQTSGTRDFDSIELIGYSPKMQKVFDMIPLLAQTDASVMITGETGTGKDKIAEIIHQKSARARFPFIKINCGALPPGLLESELFGHMKGAFTGATRNKPGMFNLADKGTLFLTEIGDMPLPLQVKLLSVLDDREFIPVGGEQKISVDVRIIAATHRPLREQVHNSTFREDLFYRLNVLHIHLPPLRERDGDIRYLLDYFLQKFTKVLSKTIVGFAPQTMQELLAYHYPGNIRELSNIVEYAVNICNRKKINTDHLPPYLIDQQLQIDNRIAPPESELPPLEQEPQPQNSLPATPNNQETWTDIERGLIVETLKEHHGNRTRVAESLGWGRMKLWRKMKKYGLQD
ncbi:MAG: sigma 54-interacting transcriptional regulator [Desulforhopalus sp.]